MYSKNHLRSIFFSLIFFLSLGCGAGPGSSEGAGGVELVTPADAGDTKNVGIPGKAIWEKNMIAYGRKHCDKAKIQELGTWEGNIWYYDGARVYYQIADYTGDHSFNDCAQYVRDVYAKYVLDSDGKIPGWRIFPHGLAINYRFTGNQESKKAVYDLSINAAFAPVGGGESYELSRETAYLINAYVTAMQLGYPQNPMLPTAVSYAKGHLKQWLSSSDNVKPFMVALTAEALISYASVTGDASVTADLPAMVDWLRKNAWDESAKAFKYIVCRKSNGNEECKPESSGPAPDLNLLIVPMIGYVALAKQDAELFGFGDKVFESGVSNAYIDGGKQFSQGYRWSFDYIKWRSQFSTK